MGRPLDITLDAGGFEELEALPGVGGPGSLFPKTLTAAGAVADTTGTAGVGDAKSETLGLIAAGIDIPTPSGIDVGWDDGSPDLAGGARSGHRATPLTDTEEDGGQVEIGDLDGQVLIVSGTSAELYDPAGPTFTALSGSLVIDHGDGFTVTQLVGSTDDNELDQVEVLVAGGNGGSNFEAQTIAETCVVAGTSMTCTNISPNGTFSSESSFQAELSSSKTYDFANESEFPSSGHVFNQVGLIDGIEFDATIVEGECCSPMIMSP